MRASILFVLMLVAPFAAGCLSGDEPATTVGPSVAKTAEEAGAQSGDAPVAPKDAYAIESSEGSLTAYPVLVQSNAARAPAVVDFSGQFTPQDCRPLNFGPLEAQLSAASIPQRFTELTDTLRVGDVFSYNITLSYVNAADNWGEIHMAYGIGNTVEQDTEPTQDMTDVVISFSGQGYRVSEDDMAWLFVACEFGAMKTPIPYTYTATFTFAEGAVPAQAPMLVSVPEGATRMFVRGVSLDGSQGVLSHFRIFKPDDTLLCECGLSSSAETATVDLPEPGDYVLLVDHTSNGFIGLALDKPTTEPMKALGAEWIETSVLVHDAGAVDETVELNLDRVPLLMFAHVMEKSGEAGVGKHTTIDVKNDRGEPLRASWGGHLAWTDPASEGHAWLGFYPDDWEYVVDHHSFAQGRHTIQVTAEELRGEVFLVTRQYVR